MRTRADQLAESLDERRQVWAGTLWQESIRSLVGCGEMASLHNPAAVVSALRGFLEAGADAMSTNTSGATPGVMTKNGLSEDGIAELAFEVNLRSASLARQVADEFSTPSHPRWVIGSMGPTLTPLTLMDAGDNAFAELRRQYGLQASALHQGGADVLHLEACQDMRNTEAAVLAIRDVECENSCRIPLMITAEVEATHTMLDGTTMRQFARRVSSHKPLAIGLTGRAEVLFATLPDLVENTSGRIAVLPSTFAVGHPDGFHENPESLSEKTLTLLNKNSSDNLRIIGVHPGSRPDFLRALTALIR